MLEQHDHGLIASVDPSELLDPMNMLSPVSPLNPLNPNGLLSSASEAVTNQSHLAKDKTEVKTNDEKEGKPEFSMADHQDFTKKRTERVKQIIWPVLSIISATIGVGLGLNNLFDFVPLDKIGAHLVDTNQLAFLLSIVGPAVFNAIGERLEKKRIKAEEKKKLEVTNG